MNFSSGDTLITVRDSLAVQSFTFDLSREPISVLFDPDGWVLEQHTVSYDPSIIVSESLSHIEGENVEIYDVSGRRVEKMYKGVYFVKEGKRFRKVVKR